VDKTFMGRTACIAGTTILWTSKTRPLPRSLMSASWERQGPLKALPKWIERCRHGIAAKVSNQPYLFSDFPGFMAEGSLHSSVYASPSLQSSISPNIFKKLKEDKLAKAAVEKSVESFLTHIEGLAAKNVSVIVCAPPGESVRTTICVAKLLSNALTGRVKF
jgi:hypothetical protein